jgi:hypothetical protein
MPAFDLWSVVARSEFSLMDTQILTAPILRRNSFDVCGHKTIGYLREGFYCRADIQVHGDAPKDFIRVYEYGRGLKRRPNSWPGHIAKVGQKYYPNESITEHLLNRIGQELKLHMAASRLMWVKGQLRFFSEYFLDPSRESLVHGAEIFAGYLANDLSFVKQVEKDGMSNQIFTIQVVEEAMRKIFQQHADELMLQFIRLVAFDALVGNNDRHFFNWGVITHIAGKRPPVFSPIYDTARALFWNYDEKNLKKHSHPNDFSRHVKKYCRESLPKTGWDGHPGLNHFDMIRKIFQERPAYRGVLAELNRPDILELCRRLIDVEFDTLFSPIRKQFILACLQERLEQYRNAVTV